MAVGNHCPVEDNIVNQMVAETILKKEGCWVHVAENGREAINLLQSGCYDMVFMDCQMPVMDGYEATSEVRRNERGGAHLPIVAMTANREKYLNVGMDDYIAKPVDVEAVRK